MKPDPHRETTIEYDKIIIGSSVEAMATAFKYGIPIFCDDFNKPLAYYYLPPDLDLSSLSVENKIQKFTLLSGNRMERGMQRIELWNILAYRLQIMGLMPFYGSYKNTFTENLPQDFKVKRFLIIVNGKQVYIKPKKTIIFDFPRITLGKRYFEVNDYIDINTVYDFPANLYLSKDCDYMSTLCYETIFYKRNAKMHGCCVKSIIHEDVINDWEKSQTSIRMSTERDIFWNINKEIKITVKEREMAPILYKMCERMEDLLLYDVMDEEIYD